MPTSEVAVDETGSPRGHIPALDGLRGLAILLVILHNASYEQTTTPTLILKVAYYAHAIGWVGVQLFFVLSGFLITGILLDSRGGPAALRSFWIRRALRIFPLYYAVLFLGAVVIPHWAGFAFPYFGAEVHARYPFVRLDTQLWYWTYSCNWFLPRAPGIPAFEQFWSLAIEEQFYLLWPFVVLTLEPRQLLRVCVVLAVVALCARFALRLSGASDEMVYQYTFTRMDALTLGAAGALVVRDPRWLARVGPQLGRAVVGLSVALSAVAAVTRGFRVDDFWVQTIGYGTLSLFFTALLLLLVVEAGSRPARWARARWLRWLGKYSYGIYVFHKAVVQTTIGRVEGVVNGPDHWVALAALFGYAAFVLGACSLAAFASWQLLERRMLALKDRWAPREAGKGPAIRSPSLEPEPAQPV